MNGSKFGTRTFIILLLASFILVVHLLWGFLTPAVMSLAIVSIFYPMHQRIAKFFGNRRRLAAFFSTLVVLLCVLVPLTLFLISLTQQALSIYQTTESLKEPGAIAVWMSSLKQYLDLTTNYLAGYGIHLTTEPIMNQAMAFSQNIGTWLYGFIGATASNFLSLSFDFILTLLLVLVFFSRGGAAKGFLMSLLPLPYNEQERLVKRFRELASAIFLGNGLVSALEGAFGALIFFAFGIPGALIWGVLMAITAFVPLIGAFIVVIPAALYIFLVNEAWMALLFIIFNAIHVVVLETVVKPRLIGTKSQMNAVLVFLSIIAGVQIYGVPGLFYGPLLVTIFLSLSQIYKEHYRDILLEKGQ